MALLMASVLSGEEFSTSKTSAAFSLAMVNSNSALAVELKVKNRWTPRLHSFKKYHPLPGKEPTLETPRSIAAMACWGIVRSTVWAASIIAGTDNKVKTLNDKISFFILIV